MVEKLLCAMVKTKSYPKLSNWEIVPMDDLKDTRLMYAEQILKDCNEKLQARK